MPKKDSAGTILNKMYRLRERKQKKQKEVDALGKQLNALKEDFLVACHNQGTETIRTNIATGTVVKKLVANVEDWSTFEEWLYENKALYMMYRRINVAPVREMMQIAEDGKPPPGVKTLEVFDVSMVTRSDK